MDNRYLFLTERDYVRVMALQPDPALRAELERAIVVPPKSLPTGVVDLYAHVRYRDETAGVSRRIQIVLPEDADVEQGKVSVLAPVGAALLGLGTGEAIDWTFPDGNVRRLRVEEVLPDVARTHRNASDPASRAVAA